MEKHILQELEQIDLKLRGLDLKLDVAEEYGTYDIMPDEEGRINHEISRLCALRKEKYSKLYEEKKLLNKLNSPKVREILQVNYEASDHEFHKLMDYEFNYLFLNLIEKAPIICEDEEALSIIYSYVTSNHYFASPQKDKVRKLLKLDARLLQNKEFLLIINSVAFSYVRNVFYAPELISNPEFIDYFINFVKNEWKYGNFYYPQYMIKGLNSQLNYDFVICLGNEKALKKYLSWNMKIELLDRISKIKDNFLKNYLLQHIFNLENKTSVILNQFFQIPEIREQLLDKKSLYYQLLINSSVSDQQDYCSPRELFNVRNDVFEEFDFRHMVHYFDSLIKGHYIYFYENGLVHHVPILSYIKNCRKKIKYYNDINQIVYGADTDELNSLAQKYKNVLNCSFKDLCIQALTESMDETLSREQIDEWDYLLEIAPIKTEEDEFSKVKEYNMSLND